MNNLVDELGIPYKYLKPTTSEERFVAIVPKSWLKSLLKHSKLIEFTEHLKLDSWPLKPEDVDDSWQKIYIRIYKKRDVKVIPLPRIIPKSLKSDLPLSFSQLMQYIAQSNYKNLWKDAYKKYNTIDGARSTQVTLSDYNEVLREIIIRTYGCPIINSCDSNLNVSASDSFDLHTNIYGAICAVETLNVIFIIYPQFLQHNLYDCLTFSPSILDKCYTKPLFLVYQLVNVWKAMHERSLTMGNITLKDIYLNDDLWLQIFPELCSNIHIQETPRVEKMIAGYDCRKVGHRCEYGSLKCSNCGLRTYDRVRVGNETLENLCKLWIDSEISNYTYLMALNAFAGRKFGDPNCHYVFPWVTDFTERSGKNWRDMKKSKFRLNKGDRQLDLTYEHAQDSQVPHHVSDVLSSITYYVYMARRTPKSVLCKNVRTNWVPAEYPSSIQRLQEWTPDECIPEFFSDPMIFKSVHDDLDDLDVPPWSSSPEDFIDKHRETLESQHVSERLHHWIDLTFGYKLSGTAAIKSKNVCLHLVDGHTNLTSSGVVQLFQHPHPPKLITFPFWGKIPPKVSQRRKNRNLSTSSIAVETSRSEEEEPSPDDESLSPRPLVISRLLSRSRSSLNEDVKREEKIRSSSSQRSSSLGPKNPSFTSHVASQKGLLPKEFIPSVALISLENVQNFLSRTFYTEEGKRIEINEIPIASEKNTVKNDEVQVQNAFTNRLFQELSTHSENYSFSIDNQNMLPFRQSRTRPTHRTENQIACPYSDIIAKRRTREIQMLGCLIVEIFMHKQIRVLADNQNHARFKHRLKSCLTVINSCKHEIPNSIRYLVQLLLPIGDSNINNFKYSTISECGLPPPSAHLLLEPLLHSLIPFNEHFSKLYSIISMLKNYETVSTELHILYHFTCNGDMCSEFEVVEKAKLQFTQNIAECKVKSCANSLEQLIEELNSSKDMEIVNILVLPIKNLIDDPPTAVLSTWYLFDSVARLLGPKRSGEILLHPILRLYEHETSDFNIPYNTKIARLYHHSFLLRLMVRFGMRTFLEHFITPLVEAVGGYRDHLEEKGFILHTHCDKHAKKANLKSFDNEGHELSPSDDSSESEAKLSVKEPEVFQFDSDEALGQLQSSTVSDHSKTEDISVGNVDDQIVGSEYKGLMTPTIPIPSRKEVSNISCDVGSKKSEGNFSLGSQYKMETAGPSNTGKSSNDRQRKDAVISSMATESVIWLSHRLGPVLTARYLSRNLLKMLTLCYVGKENLLSVPKINNTCENLDFLSIACSRVVGDNNAVKVLECLSSIAALYGHQLILYQYLPHMSELIALCKRKLTPNLEGGLISCLALLKHIIPYISDATLMENLQDVILKNILYPTIRLLGSTKYSFPNGSIARNVLARKYLDTLYVLSLRMGATMTHTQLAVPALQRFFLIFDKILDTSTGIPESATQDKQLDISTSPTNLDESEANFIEVRRDGTLAEWAIGGLPVQISRLRDSDSTDSLSPPKSQVPQLDETVNAAVNELRAVFTADLAHRAYVPFMKQIGLQAMESSLKNYQRIISLTQEYEMELMQSNLKQQEQQFPVESRPVSTSIGSNIALIGNRIDVQDDEERNADMLSYVSNKIENTQRHLRGNWLAYWEHEIGRSDKDVQFNFKQIKLQTFVGHTNSVKSLHVLDNENSFLSASKDKTVKLWSLRSQGDGTSSSTCQSTYTAHKKGVIAITFLESLRLAASCDGVVHLWDPFMCACIAQLESSKYAPVHVLKSLPAPSSLLFAASAECSVKVIDARICNYVHDLKVAVNQGVWIRCIAIAPCGQWVATGLCSGHITIVDTRTGFVLSTWRAHDAEIVQLVPADDDTLISSGMDQCLHVWNIIDGKLKFSLNMTLPRGVTEPVHCLNVNNGELISGTTGNRIGVHTAIDVDASFSSTKLRSDAFKGALVSMAMLPLNRLLLLGADTGLITLLC